MSDLLNSASLVMIPSGYKEDTVYSVVPSDGSGDLSFTRASNGTRVNSAGLVEVCPWNICTYSEELNIWTTERASVTANATTAPNGTATADKVITDSTANNTHQIYIGPFTTPNLPFVISAYAKKSEYNYIHLGTGGAASKTWFDLNNGTVGTQSGDVLSASIESVGNGWYRCINIINNTATSNYVELGPASVDGSRVISGTPSGGIFAWGAQLNIGSTAKPYFPTTDRLNVPRLTYQNGGGGCPSLLLEKQSTNYALYSEDFTSGWALTNTAATANQTTSPDGTQNADLIDNGFSNGQHRYFQNVLTGLTNETISFSIYAKQGTHRYISWGITDDSDYRGQVVVDLQTGTITDQFTTSATLSNLSVVGQGNGWYRISGTIAVSANYAGGSGYTFGLMLNSASWSTASYTGTGTYFYGWGAQAELSSYPTSYIPTTSSSATRVADAIGNQTTSIAQAFTDNTKGTIFFDLKNIKFQGGAEARFRFGDSVDSLRFAFFMDSVGLGVYAYQGGGYAVNVSTATNQKIAIRFDGTSLTGFSQGVKRNTVTAGTNYVIEQMIDNNTGNLCLEINEFVLFNSVLTDAKCIALTTI